MNKREKFLAIAVGALVLGLGALYLVNSVTDAFQQRLSKLSQLRGDLSSQANVITVGMRSLEKLADYEQRALPGDREKAHWLYQTWLIDKLEQTQLSNVNVNPLRAYDVGDVYVLHAFNVTAEGDLRKIVDFLYDFYAVDYLHRMKSLVMKPIGDTKKLGLSMTVEVMALPTAPDRDELEFSPGDRLRRKNIEAYRTAILDRNLFGPPNKEPQLLVQGTYEAEVNRPFRLQVDAKDDDQDSVSYDANLEELPSAQFDPQRGELSWVPRELGEYYVTVYAKDDGMPNRSVSREVKITVVEPPPPSDPEPEAPKFDLARFSFVTAIIRADDVPQVWLHIRPLGKTLRLEAGDTFDLAGTPGKVQQIDSNQVEFELEEELLVVELGENLREGRSAGQP